MCFHEGAAVNLFCVPSGHTGVQPMYPAKAVIDDGVAPMEARFNVEMTHAATGMRAEGASALLNRWWKCMRTESGRLPRAGGTRSVTASGRASPQRRMCDCMQSSKRIWRKWVFLFDSE